MTAPTHARTAAARSATTERGDGTTTAPRKKSARKTSTRSRSTAPERANPRRDERRDRPHRTGTERGAPRSRPQRASPGKAAPQRGGLKRASVQRVRAHKAALQSKVAHARLPFMMTVMSLLAIGLIATLWLAISAVSGSYHLQNAEAEVNALQERKEVLLREVSSLDSTPALQRRATELGMVPAPEPAYLSVQPDGSVKVVGEPNPAEAPAPPPAPQPVPPEQGQAPAPEQGQVPAPGQEQPPPAEPEPSAPPESDAPQRLAAAVPAVETP